MAFDVVIRNGRVIDGTGRDSKVADVALVGGEIAAVGSIDAGDAGEEIDASGCIVTPGFIDPHTHLDAQLCWDATGSPSNSHGVTSVVIGICGFGVAPCPPGGGEYLLRSLEVVEEIPFESTSGAVPFSWSNWSEYADFLARQPLTLNVGALVPHSALRYFVMGERARAEAASPDDREVMARELADALAAGALGFATSRGVNHRDAYQQPVPSRFADDDELRALVAQCRDRIWQINLASKFGNDANAMTEEVGAYASWTEAAGARLTWSPLFVDKTSSVWREALTHSRALNDRVVVAPQINPTPITTSLRFDRPSIAVNVKGWHTPVTELLALPESERVSRVTDPSFASALRRSELAGPGLERRYDDWIVSWSRSRPELAGRSLASCAAATGEHPVDFLCRLAVADELETELVVPVFNDGVEEIADCIVDPATLLGLGDSGAHVMTITNYSYPTYLLGTLVRDRQLVRLESAVEQMTRRPAELFGIPSRGALTPGMAADVCVIDLDNLSLGARRVVGDLPGGAHRLFQDARGYVAVFVNGSMTVRDDQPTGRSPGSMIRRPPV